VFGKERQNEIDLEAAFRTERCSGAVRRRRVGERRRWLAAPKQGRLGLARRQIALASFWIVETGLLVIGAFVQERPARLLLLLSNFGKEGYSTPITPEIEG
jgi:hypothetical protein